MINEKILSEKYRYVLISELSKEFDIFSVHVELNYYEPENENFESYDLDINFDYKGIIDSDVKSFVYDIERVCGKIEKILENYYISSEGKFQKGKSHTVDSAMIWKVDYRADELHMFEVSYRVVNEDSNG